MTDDGSLSSWLDKRAERMSLYAGYECEAHGLHHRDCPTTVTDDNAGQFVLPHVIRRQDKHDPNYDHRDNTDFLRFVFNGPTGMGAAGCHNEIHSNQGKARRLGLLAATGTKWRT